MRQLRTTNDAGQHTTAINAVQRNCACGGLSGVTGSCSDCEKKKLLGQPLQTKLRISEPADEYEREADRVAEQVMRMQETETRRAKAPTTPLVQRRVSGNGAGVGAAAKIVNELLLSPGQPLDVATRAFFETRFEHDFSRVRVHADARATDSALAVNALAYTVGNDIVFGENQYRPFAQEGRQLLAHELVHTQQQGTSMSPAVQRQNAPASSSAGYSDKIVQGHIDRAMAVNPTLKDAWLDVQKQRCLLQNCLDENLAAAEHYLFARFAVEELLLPITLVEANILGYALTKLILSFFGTTFPSACQCPATPTSAFQVRWGLKGVADGQDSPRVQASRRDTDLMVLGK
jgi:hypothetical protein